MGRGGARAGAGRKAGYKAPTIRRINVDEIMDKVGTGPDKMPLPFLLAMMHAPDDIGIKLSERIQCAMAAAPYCHARKGDGVGGKKEEQAGKAKQAGAGKFAPGRPPIALVK